jgi:leucyl-tRNA synthetase
MSTDNQLDEPTGGQLPPHRYTATMAGEIELRWQRRWEEQHTFEVPNPVGDLEDGFAAVVDRPKFFIMDMFPYPSGSGLHVGHPLGYIGSDVYARYKRMLGHLVLHPFGYDAFGLPAEQYAIETGQHPAVTTKANIDNMRRQLRRLGLTHDPRREISTADPSFYQWTQWIFLQIFDAWFDSEAGRARPIAELVAAFESGDREVPGGGSWESLTEVDQAQVINAHRLAYLGEAPVNWCPGLGTVLANEEVTAEGRSEIGNFPVYRRTMRQWMMRITDFADRLLEDLDLLDWTDSLKTMQRNWIGRSEGARVAFATKTGPGIDVFTTRPDTLFGATYMVLAPEHPLVEELTATTWPDGVPESWTGGHATPQDAVAGYRFAASRKSEIERQVESREKTGVFVGSYAVNPTNGAEIPIFIADYVLMGYGTGAIMAVPGQDERDWDFAEQFDLPIVRTVQPPDGWEGKAYVGEGPAINSVNDQVSLDGLPIADAKRAITAWLEEAGHGTGAVSYKLRDWLFSRQRYWGEPFPIVYDENDLPVGLPASMLPVTLPEMTKFEPEIREEGDETEPEPPLARVKGWQTVTLDLGDGSKTYRRETNTMPQWAGSCWYYLRYLDPHNAEAFVDPQVEQYWMGSSDGEQAGGVDLYIGGVEHAVLHLLYARFWHKVLYDLGHVSTPEPFQRLYNQGYILAPAYTDSRGRYVPAAEVEERDGAFYYDGQTVTQHAGKMGKSLKNSVSPDEIYASYGADTLRLYETAMGPLDVDRPWRTTDIVGVYRFLQRLWRNLVDETTGAVRVVEEPLSRSDSLYVELHQTIDAIRRLFSELRFNVAVARLIGLNNSLTQYVAETGKCPRAVAEPLVLMLMPLAPHIGSELWERLGHESPVDDEPFPEPDRAALESDTATLPVTVDGRAKGEVTVARDAAEEEVTAAALALDSVARTLGGAPVKKVVYVPNRILNLVTK